MSDIKLPELLNMPPKMLPALMTFGQYRYILAEGGRGSGKTQSIGRILLYIAEKRKVIICAGRVIKESVKESVFELFRQLIEKYNLNFKVSEKRIVHKETGSIIFFKGFRENEIVNVKGLEGVDILWIDEAETVTERSFDIITPTIRKDNAVLIFSMNRYVKSDAVYSECVKMSDCLHININYFDNPFCPQSLIRQAEDTKKNNIAKYNHIWLGLPKEQGLDYLIASDKIMESTKLKYNDENHPNYSVMSVDFAASGGDLCVAKRLVQKSLTVWEEEETISWSEADTDITKGKCINLYNKWKPNIFIGDADGLGYSIMYSLKNSINGNVLLFRGAGKAKNVTNGNARADGYMAVKDMLELGYLKLNCQNASRQLEYMKIKYTAQRGLIYILDKKEIRKEHNESPDYADTLMMAVYAITYYPHLLNLSQNNTTYQMNTEFEIYE